MYYFCTYFDYHFLNRGLALYRSLKERCPTFQLFILCMDTISYDILSKLCLPSVSLIILKDFEKGDEELVSVKQNRTQIEYYFTCTPSLPIYIFDHHPEICLITYLDADLFFFSDPKPIYDEIGKHSIAIIEHRFSLKVRNCRQCGIYNVGWISFRRDETGLACLKRWRNQCIEWCYDKVDNGRFGDQKYLDNWSTSFNNVKIIQHLGANLAPWNLDNYTLSEKGGYVFVNDYRLLFFHFHGFYAINKLVYNTNLGAYGIKLTAITRRSVFRPYIRTLFNIAEQTGSSFTTIPFLENSRYAQATHMRPKTFKAKILHPLRLCKRLLQKDYLFLLGKLVL